MRCSTLLSFALLATGISAAPILSEREVECRSGGVSLLNGDLLSGNASPDVYDSGNVEGNGSPTFKNNGNGNGNPVFKDNGNGSGNGNANGNASPSNNGNANGNGSANPSDSGNGNNAAGAIKGDQTAAKEAKEAKAKEKAAKAGKQ